MEHSKENALPRKLKVANGSIRGKLSELNKNHRDD
jgi:hypothetical protein